MTTAPRVLVVAAFLGHAAGLGVLGAQTPRPSFEVASVKPAPRELLLRQGLACAFGAGGRFKGFAWVRWLVACAYEIAPARATQEILGGPGWIDVDLFEIDAIAPPDGVSKSMPERLAMLRTLLADRFKLVVHRETKELPMFALVTARRDGRLGPRLHSTSSECASWIASGRGAPPPSATSDRPCGRQWATAWAFGGSAMTLPRLATLLSTRLGRPVEDRTNLAGDYDLDLQWSPDLGDRPPADGQRPPFAPAFDPDAPSLTTALQEQLGLKLESTKGSFEVLVIDRVEHPTPD
jgi:uncharacterized protein (TIGR03435 family)